jgi:16S rRNA (cytidine1402-2'-O)-methyltransferase
LPSRPAARRQAIAELAPVKATLILFESGRRLAATLGDLASGLGGREAAVARELTKRFEEVRRGTLAELRDHYAAAGVPRGEIALVVGPPIDQAPAVSDAALDAALAQALATMPAAAAATAVAAATGHPRRELYRRLLALQQRLSPSER